MTGVVAIILNFNHTTVYANCVIACNRALCKCANTERTAITMDLIVIVDVKTARFLVETNVDYVLAVHHKNVE